MQWKIKENIYIGIDILSFSSYSVMKTRWRTEIVLSKWLLGESFLSSLSFEGLLNSFFSNLFLFLCLHRRVVILMELDILKSAEAVGLKIGNPVPYNEGKILFYRL